MRDIISHHYFDIDEGIIYDVCSTKIIFLGEVVKKMIQDMPKNEV